MKVTYASYAHKASADYRLLYDNCYCMSLTEKPASDLMFRADDPADVFAASSLPLLTKQQRSMLTECADASSVLTQQRAGQLNKHRV